MRSPMQPPDTREGASASRTIPSLSPRRDASRLASLERAFARLLAKRRHERARHRLPRVPGPGPRSLGRAPRGDGDTDNGAATTSSRRSASINPILAHIHSKTRTDGARTIDDDKKQRSRSDKWKKQSARDRRRARARRDETNVCEFVRSSDARGRRPGGRTAGRARRPRWTWASAMRVVRLDRGREG